MERVARTNNNAYVRGLAADPELKHWLLVNGLTANEAAWIQPTYSYQKEKEDGTSRAGLWIKTTLAAGIGSSSIYENLQRPYSYHDGERRGLRGLVAGYFVAGIGVSNLRIGATRQSPYTQISDERQSYANYTIYFGLATMALGLKSLLFPRNPSDPKPKPTNNTPAPSCWNVQPAFAPHAARVQVAYHF